ncbi:unnamed protein product [Clonostachys rosea]|uniref:Ricin B lectin domain-containing protein n=1 Tax=Bionectria ochroleuca TaxID=29856 RepID=A0ABY6TV18_BIOOC|nr:unnamed protein product [Clonostachys rosea]
MGDDNQDYFLDDSWHGVEVALLNDDAGTALDLDCAYPKDGTLVHSWSFDRSNHNQIWKLEKVNRDSAWSPWTLTCRGNGAVLDVEWGWVDNGTKVRGWSRFSSLQNQEWYIISYRGSDRVFLLQNVMSCTYLDLNGGKGGNNVKIQAWKRNNSPAQRWRFVRI